MHLDKMTQFNTFILNLPDVQNILNQQVIILQQIVRRGKMEEGLPGKRIKIPYTEFKIFFLVLKNDSSFLLFFLSSHTALCSLSSPFYEAVGSFFLKTMTKILLSKHTCTESLGGPHTKAEVSSTTYLLLLLFIIIIIY